MGLDIGGQIDFAVSALIIRLPDFNDDENEVIEFDEPSTIGLLNIMGTVGSLDNSLTFGFGYGYAGDDWADRPFVILGGETRVFRRMSLVAESWLMPGVDEPLLAYGTRFFGEGLAVDLAFLTIIGSDGIFPGIPYLGFVYNF